MWQRACGVHTEQDATSWSRSARGSRNRARTYSLRACSSRTLGGRGWGEELGGDTRMLKSRLITPVREHFCFSFFSLDSPRFLCVYFSFLLPVFSFYPFIYACSDQSYTSTVNTFAIYRYKNRSCVVVCRPLTHLLLSSGGFLSWFRGFYRQI